MKSHRRVAIMAAVLGVGITILLAGRSAKSGDIPMNDSSEYSSKNSQSKTAVVFAAYAEDDEQLRHAFYLVESIRAFAGVYRDAPVWIYLPGRLIQADTSARERFAELKAEIRISETPDDARAYYFAGKVFAAAAAEAAAAGLARLLVWMDEDTIVLREPSDFDLPDSVSFAYRPVMHNRSGSLYDRPPNRYWSRIYEMLAVADTDLFPVVTPADRQTIRAYFNAGLLVVRPERGILRKWPEDFEILYTDPELIRMCDEDITNKIFLHQTALVGAAVNTVSQGEMLELPDRYNYPIFFHQQWDAAKEFGSIEDVVTLRYDVYFRDPDPEWRQKLKGPAHLVAWLAERLGAK
jgi:hypothetical protein